MDPVAHIWLVRLKEGHSLVEAAFSEANREAHGRAVPYATGRGEHNAIFQCEDDPDLLAVIGYGRDPNEDGSAEARGARFLEFVDHQELYIYNVEVSQFALDSDSIAILFTESQPVGSNSLPGRGAWAVPIVPLPLKGRQGDQASDPQKKTWVQVVSSEDADRLSQEGSVRRFNKFMESRIALQNAE
ncbi:hypothetical protein GGR55DRAFT_138378 [Xylaria sp. FL0064]|nr:hypothetical protein GGR55DRAFT_138378 [Xylaria sp. FL0064]